MNITYWAKQRVVDKYESDIRSSMQFSIMPEAAHRVNHLTHEMYEYLYGISMDTIREWARIQLCDLVRLPLRLAGRESLCFARDVKEVVIEN
jgi:hypothetical protein